MHSAALASSTRERQSQHLLVALGLLAAVGCALYMIIGIDLSNEALLRYALSLRAPRLMAMILAACAIGGSTIVFQTIVGNRIITPSLLGMDALYTLVHTAIVFVAGSASAYALNANLSFIVDVVLMGGLATAMYGYLFKRCKYNVLYVLLIGTVCASLFSSLQSSLIRIMDPNEYDALLSSLVASFSHVNAQILLASTILIFGCGLVLHRDLALLDVMGLGRPRAIALGVNYDRVSRRLLLGVVICTSAATAMVGPITFLGLIVANLARRLCQTYHHRLSIVAASLCGIVALTAGQTVVERVFSYTIPVSVFVTMVGGIYFLYLLLCTERPS